MKRKLIKRKNIVRSFLKQNEKNKSIKLNVIKKKKIITNLINSFEINNKIFKISLMSNLPALNN